MCDEESLQLLRLDFNLSKNIDNELVQLLRRINNIEHNAYSNNDNNPITNDLKFIDDDNNNDKKETKPIIKNRLLEVTMNAVVEAFDKLTEEEEGSLLHSTMNSIIDDKEDD